MKTREKIYDFYKGSSIVYLFLEQKDLCKPLKEAGCIIVLDSAWSDDLSLKWYEDVFIKKGEKPVQFCLHQ